MYLSVAGLFCKTQNTSLSGQISSCTGCIAAIINALAVGPRQFHPTKYSEEVFIGLCILYSVHVQPVNMKFI
jgi:hypothetical protein